MDNRRVVECAPIGEQVRQLLVGRSGRFGRRGGLGHDGEQGNQSETQSKSLHLSSLYRP
jgi:hypothetical protein